MDTQILSPFGQKLKYWRRLRGISQLNLAVDAQVSSRHISFIETGRSRPGRKLILKLADTLNVPPREQNALLEAAGLPPVYTERTLAADQLAPFRKIIRSILDSHAPFPGFVLDRAWNIVEANKPASAIFPPYAQPGANIVDILINDQRPLVENWDEVCWNLLARMREDWVASGHDSVIQEVMTRLEHALRDTPPPNEDIDPDQPVLAARIRLGDTALSTVGTIMRFGTARDITLDELRVELIFPADEATENFFRAAMG